MLESRLVGTIRIPAARIEAGQVITVPAQIGDIENIETLADQRQLSALACPD